MVGLQNATPCTLVNHFRALERYSVGNKLSLSRERGGAEVCLFAPAVQKHFVSKNVSF